MSMGFFAAGAMGRGAAPSVSLYDAIIADSPYWYLRLNDASGTTAAGSVSSRNGTYTAFGVSLGQAALYPAGPTSVLVNGSGAGVDVANANMPSNYSVFSFACVYQRVGSSTGTRQILTHGNGGSTGDQAWQFRVNSSSLEFVKVTGGVAVYTTGASIEAGADPVLLGVDVAVDGSNRRLTVYVNGSSVYTTTFSPANFNAGTNGVGIGRFFGGSFSSETNHRFSEVAFFDHAIGAARHAAYAAAGGFA